MIALRSVVRAACGLLLLSVALPVPAAHAVDAASLVPADSLVYVGWSQVLDEESEEQLDYVIPIMEAMNAPEEPVGIVEHVIDMVKIAGRRDGAITFFGTAEPAEPGAPPEPLLALVVDAGDHAVRLVKRTRQLMERQAPVDQVTIAGEIFQTARFDDDFQLLWAELDDRYVMTAGPVAAERMVKLLGGDGATLASVAEFKECRTKVGTSATPMFCAYGDVDGIFTLIGRFVAEAGASDDFDMFLDISGLRTVEAKYMDIADSPLGVVTNIYVKAPGERRGLLSLWNQRPLTDADLALIPPDATWAMAMNLDLEALYHEVMDTVAELDPAAAENARQMMTAAGTSLGAHIENELLPALGDTWILYDAPDHGGFLFTGIVISVEAKDPAVLQRVTRNIVNLAGGGVAMATPGVRVRPMTVEHDGHEITFTQVTGTFMPMAPAAALAHERFLIGLSPQAVAAALDGLAKSHGDGGILANEEANKIRAKLPDGLMSFYYVDVRHATRNSYGFWHLIQTACLSAAAAGSDADPGSLPTLEEVLADVHNAAGGWSADEDGLRYTGYGSLLQLSPPSAVAGAALPVSILLPSLARAREMARRTVSAANLSGIGQGCFVYANDHEGEFPPDLQTLLDENYLMDDAVLHSPRHAPDERSYVYVAGQHSDTADYRNVLAYEIPVDDEGTNVLFADGHVQWMKLPRFKLELRQTYERLNRLEDLPEEYR